MPKPSRIVVGGKLVPAGMLWERYVRPTADGWEVVDCTYPADGNQGDGTMRIRRGFCTLRDHCGFMHTGMLSNWDRPYETSNGRAHGRARQEINELQVKGFSCIEYDIGEGVKFHPFFEEAIAIEAKPKYSKQAAVKPFLPLQKIPLQPVPVVPPPPPAPPPPKPERIATSSAPGKRQLGNCDL